MVSKPPVLDYASPGLLKRNVSLARRLLRAALGAAGILGCAVGALLLAPLWEANARFPLRSAIAAAVCMFLLAVGLRSWRRWGLEELFLSLVPVEAVICVCIACIAGLDQYTLVWLIPPNLFIGLPWAAGLGVGTGVLAVRQHGARR